MCQDYVIATNDYIALSDGCSSAPFTDVGARLVCHAMLHGRENKLRSIVADLSLPDEALAATFLCVKNKQGSGDVSFERCGDGFLVLGMNNSKVLITETQFGANTPWYRVYHLCGWEENFRSVKNNEVITTAYILNPDLSLNCEWTYTGREEKFLQKEEKTEFSLTDVKWIAILSDGFGSFTDAQQNLIPVPEVAKHIFAFKSFHGEFVKRRMQAAFKEFAKLGWKNTDDFSIGVMHYGEL
jgi:hypothetical protein